jgi:hypothetical protein
MSVVARGKIKVDARRALSKLRDHMLVDGHLYTTEIARAAVALGATKLEIAWDSDDVWMGFDGTQLEMAAIARVRDHVLAGEGGDQRMDALRTLGIGVTAALGLEPSFVDVYTRTDDECSRVRFDHAYLAEEGAIPKQATAEIPGHLSGLGTLVHVHHALGLDTVLRSIGGAVPREIVLLLEAARDVPLALSIQGVPKKLASPAVVLRVDLDEPSATRAFLEVLSASKDVRATTTLLERGIRLVTYTGVPVWELADEELPLRLLFDAPKLPTNASRSDIRADADVWARAREHLPDAMQRAVEALQKCARGETTLGPGIEVVDPSPDAHAHALEAIAASVAIAARSGRTLPEAARALLDRPLMRDAVGAPLALARFAAPGAQPWVHVHSGEAPEPAELEPWLGGIPWLRGTPIDRAFAGFQLAPADTRIAVAHAAFRRRQRAFEHPASKPVLPASPGYVLQESFAVTEGPFAGLEGSVALVRTEGPYRRSASVRAFVDDRLLESAPLPAVSLPVDIALAWPGHVIARDAYDAVLRNPDFESAILYALRVAAMAVALRLVRRDPEMIRLATLAWLGATRSLGDVAPSLEALGPIAAEDVWPTSERGVLVSLKTIDAYARKTGAVCTSTSNTGRAADGRPVLDPATATSLLPVLPPKTVLVPYDAWLAISEEAVTRELAKEAAMMPAFLPVSRGPVRGFLGALPSNIRHLHRGQLIDQRKRSVPGLAVLEDPAAVPKPGKYHTTGIDLRREDIELLELVIDRCTNGQLALSAVQPYLDDWRTVFAKRATAARHAKARNLALSFLQKIEGLPTLIAEQRRTATKTRFLSQQPWTKLETSLPTATHSVDGVGAATVFLDSSWKPPPIAILVHGRLIGHREIGVPVLGWVDITGDDLVNEEWTALSERGVEWTTDALRAAAMKLLREIAMQPGFASDVAALRLCAATLRDESARVLLRDTLGRVRWPTVQGGERTVGLAESVPCGAQAFAAYERGNEHSPYDEPAIHLPANPVGDLRREVLGAIGVGLVDVTAAIARLQERRMRGKGAPPPRLAGAPVHPRLRATLDSLGVTAAEGEIELAERMESIWFGPDGVPAEQSLVLPFPVRVVFRATDPMLALPEIATAAEKLAQSLAAKLDPAFPPFVTTAIRSLACATALQDNAATRAKIFRNSRGGFLSLAEMKAFDSVRVTFDPAHAQPGDGPTAVFLTPAETAALRFSFKLTDITEQIRAARLGAERRNAPPRTSLDLTDEQRARCLVCFRLDDKLDGEAGLLAPEWEQLRAVEVYTGYRRLALVSDHEGGWPTIAIVNDPRVTSTPAFDAIAKKDDLIGLWASLRQTSARHASIFLTAPNDALGVVRLPFPFLAGRTPCLGVFWLEPSWPDEPSVEIVMAGAKLARPPMTPHGLLPIRGRAFVLCGIQELDAVLPALFEHVRTKLGTIAKAKSVPEYAWDLRLLGALSDVDPKTELAKPEPDVALLRVVAKRAPHLIVPPKPEIVVPEIESVPTPRHIPPAESFFEGLSRTVVELIRPDPAPPVDAKLEQAVLAMKLTGDPVTSIATARSGRPIRYEAESRTLVVNTRHASVRALDEHPARIFHLLTAAVSEINRELEPVTDAEELAVLRDLLQQT